MQLGDVARAEHNVKGKETVHTQTPVWATTKDKTALSQAGVDLYKG